MDANVFLHSSSFVAGTRHGLPGRSLWEETYPVSFFCDFWPLRWTSEFSMK